MMNNLTPCPTDYHNPPELLLAVLESITFPALVSFCQENNVQIIRGEDYQYECHIDKAVYAVELDAVSAMIMGVNRFIKMGKPRL